MKTVRKWTAFALVLVILTSMVVPAQAASARDFYDVPQNWAYDGIDFCVRNGIMKGVGSGSFAPQKATTRAEMVVMLWRIAGEPRSASISPFEDLAAWQRMAVDWAYYENVVEGVSFTRFNPNAPITRQEMATMLYRFCDEYWGYDMSYRTALGRFRDGGQVSRWARDAMAWTVDYGYIQGVATNGGIYLQPKTTSSRAVVATFIARFIRGNTA